MFGPPPKTGSAVSPPAVVAKDDEISPEGMTGIGPAGRRRNAAGNSGGDTARARGDRRSSDDNGTGVVLVVSLLIFIIFVSWVCSVSFLSVSIVLFFVHFVVAGFEILVTNPVLCNNEYQERNQVAGNFTVK